MAVFNGCNVVEKLIKVTMLIKLRVPALVEEGHSVDRLNRLTG